MWLLGRRRKGREGLGISSLGLAERAGQLFERSKKIEAAREVFLPVKRKVTLGLCVLLSLVFLALGTVGGFVLRGLLDRPSNVFVTVPAAPETATASTAASVSKPSTEPVSVSRPSGLDSLALETQALKKRVQQMK